MATMTPELYELIIKIVDERVREIRVTREDFDKLTATVNKLAEAQHRTEERLEQLAEAQRRTEERLTRLESVVEQLAEAQRRTEERLTRLETRLESVVEQLAEAQRRTEERLTRLESVVEQLAEAQRRTEDRLEQLAEAQRRTEESLRELAVQVGRLSDTVGFGLEDVARVMAPGWFERHLGIAVEEELEPRYVRHGEAEVQVNLFGRGRRADGTEVLIAGEVKSRIYKSDVRSFASVVETVRNAYPGREVLAFMFGYLIHPSADEEAEKHGIVVLATYRR
ncbi:MAG: hypothetical protein ACTSP1_19580 [Candidatus Freyarchaeota archaeon]